MIKKVCRAVEVYNMFSHGDEVLVGLSGGADSVALLICLLKLRKKYGISVKAMHINHLLRGDEAFRDEKFVDSLCKRLDVPLKIERVNVRKIAEEKRQSTELAARNVRYSLFSSTECSKIATAHTASDNLETVILNLARGTAGTGLCGIPPVRGNIVRPLILCTRDEITDFLKQSDEVFVTDSTNSSYDYSRNVVRHSVVPVFKNLNVNAENAAVRMSAALREDMHFIAGIAKSEYNKAFENGKLSTKIGELPQPVLKRVLQMYYFDVCPDGELDSQHINSMLQVVSGQYKRVSLPCGFVFAKYKQEYIIEKGEKPIEYNRDISLFSEEAKSVFPQLRFVEKQEYQKISKINKLLFKFSIDCDKIIGNTTVRSRLNGDSYRPVGRNVTKSLRKLLCENGCSQADKNSLTVLCDDKGIIYTNLFGIDERVKVDESSDKIAMFKF